MSNTPSSPVGLSIQRSALLFVVLVLVLGALLLAANSIDPKASVRPGINYAPWTSSDGLVAMEYPKGWTQQSNGLGHQFISDDKNTGVQIIMLRTDQIKQTGVTANTTPEELIKLVQIAPNATIGAVTPITVGDLKGAAAHETVISAGQPNTPSVSNAVDVWVLALDPTHVLVATAAYPSNLAAQNQPIFEHMMGTLQVSNIPAVIKAIDAAVPTATATPTVTLTRTPTATFTNTPTPTNTNTPLPTATPTNTPTSTHTNTPLPTATFTNTATNVPTNTPLPTSTTTPTNTTAPTNTPITAPTTGADLTSTPTATPTAL